MQKKFLITLIKFIAPFLIFLVALTFGLKVAVSYKCDYKFDKKYNTIILGHSQPENAFNDSLIENTKNFCNGGEAYVYTLQKLRKITTENPQVKMVLVSFSNNQFDDEMDKWTYRANSMNAYYSRYSFAMDSDDYLLFLKKSIRNVLDAELKGVVMNAKCILRNKNRIQNKDFGSYLYTKGTVVDSLISHGYLNKVIKRQNKVVSEVNLNYLKKIVEFCKEKKLKIIFVRTPLQEKFRAVIDEKKFQDIRNANFASVPFIDLSKYPIKNDEFHDLVHLNYKGARKISIYLNKLLINMHNNDCAIKQ